MEAEATAQGVADHRGRYRNTEEKTGNESVVVAAGPAGETA